MKKTSLLLTFLFVVWFINLNAQKPLTFDFEENHQEWVGDFADYPVDSEAFYELAWGWTNLPKSLTIDGKTLSKGIYLSGNNHSDDLFMFIKRSFHLKPNTDYSLHIRVLIESNIPVGQAGIGGSPGESVYFKVGASTIEPKKIKDDGFYLLNVDKNNQGGSGKNAIVVGGLENPLVDHDNPKYEPKELFNEEPLVVKTDENGDLWIFLGTDSGFEGTSTYFIAKIEIDASPL